MDRASTGVLAYDEWAKKLDTVHWRRVLRMVRRAELLFESFAGDEVLHHIQAAQSAVPYKTMTAPPDPRHLTLSLPNILVLLLLDAMFFYAVIVMTTSL